MDKQYKYTKKSSILAALGFEKPSFSFFKVLVNCIPAIAVGIMDFLFAQNEIISSNILCNIFEYVLFSIFAYVLFCYVEYFLIDLSTELLLTFLDMIAKVKQRYLPITLEDLEINSINTIDQYWDYIGNILKIRGMAFPIINEEARKQCEAVFAEKFADQSCTYKGNLCSYQDALKMMSEDTGYDKCIRKICDIGTYKPWIINYLSECL